MSAANGGRGGKRKIDDEIELAKQKAQAIAARFLNDVDAKRPRTGFDSATPPSSFSSSQPSFPGNFFWPALFSGQIVTLGFFPVFLILSSFFIFFLVIGKLGMWGISLLAN